MLNFNQFHPRILVLSIVWLNAGLALADNGKDDNEAYSPADLINLDEVVVTAVAQPKSKLESSVSVSSLSTDEIQNFAPRSTAEIFRNIPGIRSESSGGEGNANITVRGVPIATGGAKFLQLHEDGLPVMQFGDISFGNADIFLRADYSIERIEAIRGGSASTFASNSPAGVINFISKTGAEEGGSIGVTIGLDYDSFRNDFEYGGALSQDWRFHIGGFYRDGEGPREPGYSGNAGGQIKLNLTREFENGYARVYAKHLDDRGIAYLPMPMTASGGSITGFDALEDTVHTPYLLSNVGVDGDGNFRRSDISEGMHPISTALGGEFSFDLGDDWTLGNKFRKAFNEGRFLSPFVAEVADAQSIADSIGGAGSSLSYANGPSAGSAIENPAALNGNGLALRVHLFDTELNSLDNFSNDFKLRKTFSDAITMTFGYYKATQTIDMSWLWNSYLLEARGDEAALLNVTDAAGNPVTEQGLIAYGVPFWDNCCTRNYDAEYDIDAPYSSIEIIAEDYTIEASLRYDKGKATGSYAGSVQRSDIDVNNDGSFSTPEQSVSFVDTANVRPINYDWEYLSYSVGLNYLIADNMGVFGRLSHGARANADRLLFTAFVLDDGSTLSGLEADEVDQLEAGLKYRGDIFGLFATAFLARVEEQNFEATTQRTVAREYEAAGIEFEGRVRFNNFILTGSVTVTDAEISEDKLNPELEGNTPRRQADVIYTLTPTYLLERLSVGANVIGTTDSYAQDNNELKLDGYAQVNAFVTYMLTEGLFASVNVNNLFDESGLTEAEEGVAPANDIIRARSINGRSTTVSLKYIF